MRAITGEDVGTTIDFRVAGQHEAVHPWPEDTTVSAGRGVVFRRRSRDSYSTLFMEVYPPGASFIRGEGSTPEECENSAWAQYQNALHCPGTDTGDHEWTSKGYMNGAGFCRHCNTFRSKVFTGEQLGQFCQVCGTGATYQWEKTDEGDYAFFCKLHHVVTGDDPLEELLATIFDPSP